MKHLGLALIACTVMILNYLTDVSDLSAKTQAGWNWSTAFVLFAVYLLWKRDEP